MKKKNFWKNKNIKMKKSINHERSLIQDNRFKKKFKRILRKICYLMFYLIKNNQNLIVYNLLHSTNLRTNYLIFNLQ